MNTKLILVALIIGAMAGIELETASECTVCDQLKAEQKVIDSQKAIYGAVLDLSAPLTTFGMCSGCYSWRYTKYCIRVGGINYCAYGTRTCCYSSSGNRCNLHCSG